MPPEVPRRFYDVVREKYKVKKIIKITTPLIKESIKKLKAGDMVLITGRLITARDLAHKALYYEFKKKGKLPIDLNDQIIYYTGPTPAPKGKIIGSCGPTTSSRMDSFTEAMFEAGAAGVMGKGERGLEVMEAIKKYETVYFAAPAGCGAYLSKKVKKACVCLYKELGPEAVFSLEVADFPAVVAIDYKGNCVYPVREYPEHVV